MRSIAWPFPSLDSLRSDEASGLESGVTAAILIVPLSVWASSIQQIFIHFFPATAILVSASSFVLLCLQVAIWVGFFFRTMETAPRGGTLLCLVGFGCYVATVAWGLEDLDRLAPCLIFLQTVGALFLLGAVWDEWEPKTLRTLAVMVCLAYLTFASAYVTTPATGRADCAPLALSADTERTFEPSAG